MDTVEFTPFRSNSRVSAVIGAVAGIALGVCGTAMVTASTSADADGAGLHAGSSASSTQVAAAQVAAIHRQLRAADCRYVSDLRRIRQSRLPWSADAAAHWLSHPGAR
jgi:hypothetical protein